VHQIVWNRRPGMSRIREGSTPSFIRFGGNLSLSNQALVVKPYMLRF